MTLDLDAEAAATTTALRALAPTEAFLAEVEAGPPGHDGPRVPSAPELTSVSVITTSRPFYGARVGDLRATAAGWLRAHPGATPAQVAGLADRLWRTGVREEQLVACLLLARDRAALAATDPGQVRSWTALLDNWETTDQLGMNVLGPLVAADPAAHLGLLATLAGDPSPWARRLALVACTRLARADDPAGWWPAVAELVLALAGDRQAALPKASSWVLRSWLAPCPGQVAAFVDANAGRLPALAVRETRAKLATGSKRPTAAPIHRGTTPAVPRTPPVHRGTTPAVPRTPPAGGRR